MPSTFDDLIKDIRQCSVCVDTPDGLALPHAPRPVFQVSQTAKIGIFGQAPGNLAQQSGRPFTDPSGERLREWLGVSEAEFYDPSLFAVVPMGFCFPGTNAKGGDLPPRKECARQWRGQLLEKVNKLETIVLVGAYAQRWHLKAKAKDGVTKTVERWRDFAPLYFPTPHPSWRNNSWLKKNRWFESDLLPVLRQTIRTLIRDKRKKPLTKYQP